MKISNTLSNSVEIIQKKHAVLTSIAKLLYENIRSQEKKK